jgi:hypothetical protein
MICVAFSLIDISQPRSNLSTITTILALPLVLYLNATQLQILFSTFLRRICSDKQTAPCSPRFRPKKPLQIQSMSGKLVSCVSTESSWQRIRLLQLKVTVQKSIWRL